VVRLNGPLLDFVRFADHIEAHLTRPSGVTVARLIGERDAIVGQDRVDAVGHRFQQVFEKLPRRSPISRLDRLGDGEFAGAVDAGEQVELAFSGLHPGNIHVEEAGRVALEVLSLRLVPLDVRQTGYAMTLEAAVQR